MRSQILWIDDCVEQRESRKAIGVGGGAVQADLGNASQIRHGTIQFLKKTSQPLILSGMSGASRTLERAIKASHGGPKGPSLQAFVF